MIRGVHVRGVGTMTMRRRVGARQEWSIRAALLVCRGWLTLVFSDVVVLARVVEKAGSKTPATAPVIWDLQPACFCFWRRSTVFIKNRLFSVWLFGAHARAQSRREQRSNCSMQQTKLGICFRIGARTHSILCVARDSGGNTSNVQVARGQDEQFLQIWSFCDAMLSLEMSFLSSVLVVRMVDDLWLERPASLWQSNWAGEQHRHSALENFHFSCSRICHRAWMQMKNNWGSLLGLRCLDSCAAQMTHCQTNAFEPGSAPLSQSSIHNNDNKWDPLTLHFSHAQLHDAHEACK